MTDYTLIRRRVAAMKAYYGNAAPREILDDKGIALLEMPMGKAGDAIKGFILKSSRMITVGINTDLPVNIQNKVLLHEIGHYDLAHLNTFRAGTLSDTSFGYRRDSSLLSRLENEANFFASDYILDTGEALEAIHTYDLMSAARMLCVPVEFLDYKLRLLYHTGSLRSYRDLLSVKSDCLKDMRIGDSGYECA